MKTFYSAYTCQGNVGDILITKYQIEEYAKYGEVYVDCTGMPNEFRKIILNSNNPNVKDFVTTYGVSYRGIKMFNVIRLLEKEGFTHFTKSPGPYAVIDFPLISLITRIIGALGYWYAKHLGMKVFALGIDLILPKNGLLRGINIKYFSLYESIGLRSKNNQKQLSSLLNNTIYCPDMAFLYPNRERCIGQSKRVAISFRKVNRLSSLEKGLDNLCNYLYSNKIQIDFVYQAQEDFDLQRSLAERYKGFGVRFCQKQIEFNELSNYSQYDYVISNRLHVLLMGAIHGAVPVAFISKSENENKIMTVFECVFEKNLCYFLDDNWEERMSALMLDYTLKKSIVADIQKQMNIVKEIIRNNYDIRSNNNICI